METHTLDASKEPLGRLASQAAVWLMGKDQPSFERHAKRPVRVIVTQSDKLVLTGRKWQQKTYHRHSGYIGKLKTFSAGQFRDRDSRELVRRAVKGMLPKNRLQKQMMKNLIVHKGPQPQGKASRDAS